MSWFVHSGCKGPGVFPHPYDCTQFLICADDHGKVIVVEIVPCPEGYIFSASEKTCVRGEKVTLVFEAGIWQYFVSKSIDIRDRTALCEVFQASTLVLIWVVLRWTWGTGSIRKTEALGYKPELLSWKISHKLAWDWTRAFALTGRRLTTWFIARPNLTLEICVTYNTPNVTLYRAYCYS